MALTIGNWIFFGIIILVGLGISGIMIYAAYDNCNKPIAGIINICVTCILAAVYLFGISWYHNNTAEGARTMKDYTSNMDGGLCREITITAEDGRLIYHYEGKVDIETKHEGNANYILFEGEDGLRRIIYYGIQDTVLIEEKQP